MTYTVSAGNETALTAYIAVRAAHDHVTLTNDQALAELLVMGNQVKVHGNRFHA